MEVTLTPEMRAFVDRLVRDGSYGSAADVIRAGVAALMRQERVEELDAGSLEAIYPGLLQKIRGGLEHSSDGSVGLDAFADYEPGSVPYSKPFAT
jgi:putative addiction module CopG family antidote